MGVAAVPSIEPVGSTASVGTRKQIRSSSLLLMGRLLSMLMNAAVQVLTVNYLSKTDYGALAYALSIVAMGETITTFGLDRAITRFVPIYDEQHDYGKLLGTILLVMSTMLSLGIALCLLVIGLQDWIAQVLVNDPQALALLLILIALSPLQAFDGVLTGMFAVFDSANAIFFRRYVLAPGLKIAIIGLLILGHRDVYFLAAGQVAAGLLGVVFFVVTLFRLLRKQELFRHFNLRAIQIPAREVLSFTIPLLTSDLVYIVMNSSDAILLEHFGGAVDVASFRAVQTPASFNQVVLSTFGLLFTPAAARLFATKDREGINRLYWQSAIWMAVISFPVFALTFSLAQPVTRMLYGERYSDSAIILALLSLGYYFSTATGNNGLTLKVFGKVRYSVVINIVAATLNLGVNLLLIPRYGSLGAAFGTAGTMLIHNLLKQAGLRLGTGISIFKWDYARVYMIIVVGALGLLLVQITTSPHLYVSLALLATISAGVLWLNRRLLDIEHMFPELLRLPFVRRLLTK